MKTTDVIRRAGRNLRQAKARTILTSLAIGVGAFTIALAMAAGNGGRSYLDSVVSGAGDLRTIQVSPKFDTDPNADTKPKKVGAEEAPTSPSASTIRELTPKDRSKIAAIDGVEKVSPVFGVEAQAVEANGSDKYQGQVKVQYDGTAIDLTAGKLGSNNEILPGQIVLPHVYLDSFGFKNAETALDKTVTVTFANAFGGTFTKEFKIVAVDAKPTSPLAFYNNEFRISNKDGEEIAKMQRPEGAPEGYYAFMVTARQGVNVDTVKQKILDAGSFSAMTFAEMRTSIMQMVNIVQYGLMGFGALAILASIFGIINTQYISVLERTQQIGLMKALGMRRRDVSRLFRYEAAWIGFLGGVIGVVLAFLVTLLNPVITGAFDLESGTELLQMDWLMSAVLVVGLMLIAIISGYFPSRKAAKLDPIEALRTE
ncbi:ABC transporter permease [Candidatus Saccharibacteria bacterium TM7i]|nr:ABC transporter permease [Candidatus Saccharibacteria bacterium TM7i]